jgi:hypothetical protein
MTAPGDRMRQAQTRNVGHACRGCDRIALRPKHVSHEGQCSPTSASNFDSVTHGAGGAATSMSVCGDDCRARVGDRREVLLAGEGTCVALIKMNEMNAWQLVDQRFFEMRKERHRIWKAIREEGNRFAGRQQGRVCVRLDWTTRHTTWIQELHSASLAPGPPTQRPDPTDHEHRDWACNAGTGCGCGSWWCGSWGENVKNAPPAKIRMVRFLSNRATSYSPRGSLPKYHRR